MQAPSSYNTQPWVLRIVGPTCELWADRSRALPVVDPEGRELVISCGAALHHLRVAIARSGYTPLVAVLPEPATPDLLARIELGPRVVPSDDIVAFSSAIDRRATNRFAFHPKPVPPQVVLALREAADDDGAWLVAVLGVEHRHAMADVIAEADRLQWHDHAFRSELARWLRPNSDEGSDGMPGYAQGLSDLAAHLGPLIVRTFDRGDGQAAKDHELAEGAPLLAVLGTMGDGPRDWLAAGEALSRVLLRATTLQLAASFLNQPIEIPSLRARVAEQVGVDGSPQLLLRIGYPATEARATPRRAVEDVLRWREQRNAGHRRIAVPSSARSSPRRVRDSEE